MSLSLLYIPWKYNNNDSNWEIFIASLIFNMIWIANYKKPLIIVRKLIWGILIKNSENSSISKQKEQNNSIRLRFINHKSPKQGTYIISIIVRFLIWSSIQEEQCPFTPIKTEILQVGPILVVDYSIFYFEHGYKLHLILKSSFSAL